MMDRTNADGHADFDSLIESLSADDLYSLARRANCAVFERAQPIAHRVARAYCKRYTWIDIDDLTQDLMYEIPRIMWGYREDNAAGNPWSKYLYHKLYFRCKDVLRKEDPLGIGWPQKREYPQWHRLGDESLEGFEPRDGRETSDGSVAEDAADKLGDDMLQRDIRRWQDLFESLPPMRKQTRDRIWDSKLHRVKFRRHVVGLGEWYRQRKQPRQLSFLMN